LTQLKD